jgi:hypothetical protein
VLAPSARPLAVAIVAIGDDDRHGPVTPARIRK